MLKPGRRIGRRTSFFSGWTTFIAGGSAGAAPAAGSAGAAGGRLHPAARLTRTAAAVAATMSRGRRQIPAEADWQRRNCMVDLLVAVTLRRAGSVSDRRAPVAD